MKQTAVEWLEEKMQAWGDLPSMRETILKLAKEKEKEQIIAAHKTATLEAGFEHSADDWANQYYNQTFKSTADESQTDRTIQS